MTELQLLFEHIEIFFSVSTKVIEMKTEVLTQQFADEEELRQDCASLVQ